MAFPDRPATRLLSVSGRAEVPDLLESALDDLPAGVTVEPVTPTDLGAELAADDVAGAIVDWTGRSEMSTGPLEAITTDDPSVPIVALVSGADRARDALAAGATDYLDTTVVEYDPGLVGRRLDALIEASAAERPRAWFEELLAHSPDSVAVLEADGAVEYQSGTIASALGHDPAVVIGANSEDYVHPEDWERVVETIGPLLDAEPGETATVQYRFRDATDEWVWLETVGTRLSEAVSGEVVLNSRIIAERKENQRQLERYRTLLELMPDTVVVANLEGEHEAIYGFEGWSGYEREELLEMQVSETLPEADFERTVEVILELLEDDGPEKVKFELEVETASGERIPFENHISLLPPDEDGEVPGTMSVLRNISDRKERERELALRTRAMDEAPIGITISEVVPDGLEIDYANEGLQRMTGYDEAELQGRSLTTLTGEETDPGKVAEMQAALEGADSGQGELLLYDSVGSPFWARVTLAPVSDESGDVGYVVAFLQDVTERKEYETEIERRFDEFSDVFAAELRDPIAEARAELATARESGDEEAIDAAARWLDRLDELLDDLAAVHSHTVPSRDHSETALRTFEGE